RPDGPEHCDIAVGRTGSYPEVVILTSVGGSPRAQTPATHCAVIGHAVIISASPAASYWTTLALMALLSASNPGNVPGFSFGECGLWDVRFWPLGDMPLALTNVCFRGEDRTANEFLVKPLHF